MKSPNFFPLVSAMMLCAGSIFNVQAASYTSTVEPTSGTGIIQFSELDLTPVTHFDDNGKVAVRANLTTNTQSDDPIVIKGVWYKSGVGTHAPSKAVIKLNGSTRFYSTLGVDDDADNMAEHGIVDYTVTLIKDNGNTRDVKYSGTVTRQGNDIVTVDMNVTGYDYLMLDYTTGDQPWADHCVWADARFYYTGNRPQVIDESDMYADTSNPNIINLPESGENGEEIIPLSSMDLTKITNGWGTVKANKSIDNNPLRMKGITYTSGVGAHASARVNVKLNGAVTKFHAVIGIDDEVRAQASNDPSQGVCNYSVVLRKQNGESTEVASGEIKYLDTKAVTIDIDNLSDYKYLILDFPEGAQNGNDHVDIANAYFEYVEQNSTRPVIVTEDEMVGNLNCATIMFSQPGVRYMHKLRSSNPDAVITVSDLPAGLVWNEKRSLVEGIIDSEGEYSYMAHVTYDGETADEPISLTVSSSLQQPVPFMGWLSWNVVEGDISENVIATVADAFVSQGLLDAGYNYLVIDDLWHANARQAGTNKPLPDPAKFPNGIKVCADYVHSKNLKFGIYSDAGTSTCAGKFGSYGYETIDANQYAEWGVDLLKYDYCFAPGDLASCKSRYKAMGDALKASGRNILFYICEWGVREPWKWGTETGGTCWRATYDTRDGWTGINGGIGIVQSVAGMKDLWPYSGVNRFNDADMMCVGINGTGKSSSDLVLRPAGMTKTEYRTQFSMWCMWASPLTLSFDLREPISAEDLAIMTNSELIAINQDRMGQAAEFVSEDSNEMQLYFKDLENGDIAVAVLNMSSSAHPYTVDFSKISALEPDTEYNVRDLVNHADMPIASNSLTFNSVASHETKVVRLSRKDRTGLPTSLTEALDNMTAIFDGNGLTVCLPGTDGATKRLLVSDPEGRIHAAAEGPEACFEIPFSGKKGAYIINVVCAGRHHSTKLVI